MTACVRLSIYIHTHTHILSYMRNIHAHVYIYVHIHMYNIYSQHFFKRRRLWPKPSSFKGLYVIIHAFVCMHVCMHAMYVCVYACIYVCMYACMHVCMHVFMNVSMYACVNVCMHVCVYVCMYVCMYVCVCMYVWEVFFLQTYWCISMHMFAWRTNIFQNLCACIHNMIYIHMYTQYDIHTLGKRSIRAMPDIFYKWPKRIFFFCSTRIRYRQRCVCKLIESKLILRMQANRIKGLFEADT